MKTKEIELIIRDTDFMRQAYDIWALVKHKPKHHGTTHFNMDVTPDGMIKVKLHVTDEDCKNTCTIIDRLP